LIDRQTEPGSEDEQAWKKANLHYDESQSMDLTKAPSAVVDSAYYAMHHAARAVILKLDGEQAATKHQSVISRFGQIAKNHPTDSDELMKLGRYINRVYEERLDSDYDVREATTANKAAVCLNRAKEFLDGCRRIFGFNNI
jgi:uncharacterized protein (UPF0332 family)